MDGSRGWSMCVGRGLVVVGRKAQVCRLRLYMYIQISRNTYPPSGEAKVSVNFSVHHVSALECDPKAITIFLM